MVTHSFPLDLNMSVIFSLENIKQGHKLEITYLSLLDHTYEVLSRNRDLKHHDGSHDDGIPEANFLLRSCAETE